MISALFIYASSHIVNTINTDKYVSIINWWQVIDAVGMHNSFNLTAIQLSFFLDGISIKVFWKRRLWRFTFFYLHACVCTLLENFNECLCIQFRQKYLIIVVILWFNNFNLLSIQTIARKYNTIAKLQEIVRACSTSTKTRPRPLIQKQNIHYGTILSIIIFIFDFSRISIQ